MKEQYVIWGSSGFAFENREIIEDQGGRVIAVFDNNPKAVSIDSAIPLFIGAKGFRTFLMTWENDTAEKVALNGVVAIGSSGKDRLGILKMFRDSGLRTPNIRANNSSVSSTAQIGFGCYFGSNSIVAPHARIGDACAITQSAVVSHECQLGHGVYLSPNSTICGIVSIGNFAFIGANATVVPRKRIGENAVVGAGAVVTQDVEPNSVVAGNPARSLN